VKPSLPLITMTASEIAAFGEMPLNKKIKCLCCRTGNYLPFHFFQLKHSLPESADLINSQNFSSWRPARLLSDFLFVVLIPFTSFHS
jgi:hypothetical protein